MEQKKCKKCEGINLFPEKDYIYNIEYLKCLTCGEREYFNDGLGILRMKLPTGEKNYQERECMVCKEFFKPRTGNRKICYKKECITAWRNK